MVSTLATGIKGNNPGERKAPAIRAVIVDDHELIREGVKKIVRAATDMTIVGEAGTLPDALEVVTEQRPDLVILDLNLKGHDGMHGLARIKERFPRLPVLVLSMFEEERYAIRALRAGARGYITKSMAAEELVKAIRRIVTGGTYIGPAVAELLAARLRDPGDVPLHEHLTSREMEILCMLGTGLPAKQIAAVLEISISSVNTYRGRILKKLDVPTTAALVRYAVENGLVS